MSSGVRMRRAGFVPTSELQSKYERIFSQFVCRVLESMWCFGIAAVIEVPDADIGSAPMVLSLELMRVGVYVDYTGRRTYAFYEENFTHGIYGQSSMGLRAIPDVTVHSFSPPSHEGVIHSSISRIMPYFNQMLIATESDLRVIVSNSAPSLWTQSQLAKFGSGTDMTSQNKTSARAAAVSAQDGGGVRASEIYQAPVQTGRVEPVLPVAVLASRDVDTQSSRMMARMPQLDEGMRVMKLPDGQDGHAFAAAPEPVFLPHYVEKFEQSVADAFKVPVTLFCADKLMRRDRTSHSQRIAADMVLLEQNVRVLQQQMLGILNDTTEKMYGARFREDALLVAVENPAYSEIAVTSPQMQWEFETLVDPATVRQLWLEGSFKRDEYVAYIARHYGLDPSCFESQPQMTLLDLNGVKPPPPEDAQSALHKKRKKDNK